MEGLSQRHYLTPLFEPGSVAIIGASEEPGSVGAVLMANMLAAKYRGALHAVNPRHRSVQGVPCFDAIGKVPQRERYAHMAIHPYASHLVSAWQPPEDPVVALRPIRPEDAEIEQVFVRALSPESRYFRFMDTLRELTPGMLVRFTQIDYDREMAFVATVSERGAERELGVCRYVTNPDGGSCEFALVVTDEWQRRGLGGRMMALLIDVARARGLREMIGHVLAENRPMLALCEELGFESAASSEGPQVRRLLLALARP